jgi:hypothetical protein
MAIDRKDAKRPHRERETLVGEHTTIIIPRRNATSNDPGCGFASTSATRLTPCEI